MTVPTPSQSELASLSASALEARSGVAAEEDPPTAAGCCFGSVTETFGALPASLKSNPTVGAFGFLWSYDRINVPGPGEPAFNVEIGEPTRVSVRVRASIEWPPRLPGYLVHRADVTDEIGGDITAGIFYQYPPPFLQRSHDIDLELLAHVIDDGTQGACPGVFPLVAAAGNARSGTLLGRARVRDSESEAYFYLVAEMTEADLYAVSALVTETGVVRTRPYVFGDITARVSTYYSNVSERNDEFDNCEPVLREELRTGTFPEADNETGEFVATLTISIKPGIDVRDDPRVTFTYEVEKEDFETTRPEYTSGSEPDDLLDGIDAFFADQFETEPTETQFFTSEEIDYLPAQEVAFADSYASVPTAQYLNTSTPSTLNIVASSPLTFTTDIEAVNLIYSPSIIFVDTVPLNTFPAQGERIGFYTAPTLSNARVSISLASSDTPIVGCGCPGTEENGGSVQVDASGLCPPVLRFSFNALEGERNAVFFYRCGGFFGVYLDPPTLGNPGGGVVIPDSGELCAEAADSLEGLERLTLYSEITGRSVCAICAELCE